MNCEEIECKLVSVVEMHRVSVNRCTLNVDIKICCVKIHSFIFHILKNCNERFGRLVFTFGNLGDAREAMRRSYFVIFCTLATPPLSVEVG